LLTLLLVSVAPTFAQDETSECEGGFRLFDHALGTTCIPEQPQRIASTRADFITTPLLDIGAPVIASPFREMEDGSTVVRGASDIFGDAFMSEVNLINLGFPVNPEVMLEANPDLIIGWVFDSESYDELSAIAPTVLIDWPLPMLEIMETVADASGLAGVYDARLAEYEARIEEARASIDDPASITISRLDIADDGLWYQPGWGAMDQVIDDIGFSRPEIQTDVTEPLSGISIEEIMAFDGDIILSSYAPRFGQTIESLESGSYTQANSIWLTLPGVQVGNHYWFERDIWRGTSFASLNAVLDGLMLLTAGRNFE
ncbi:MAG: ABC transporter substrate-binding protein, partial [Chloroflexota bacterium]